MNENHHYTYSYPTISLNPTNETTIIGFGEQNICRIVWFGYGLSVWYELCR